ncbi:hypothetical protein MPTK1_6g07240 [Marchantia polymorpha subsp. ruderalis]|nr:hypothetical protein MARPO_0053s0038 [Marchantia polymorpha]BBN13891.1 hypothetical protein Mp_6g07240 [Marchantia polymorpha subsp. ruderalis]PTQ38093.1 hypothetical protein MARPO_0053s0038 [Marchantia polymorpha]PTQ38094.1 hypothetical protein MARPO_0053s0038 [Marchantia polymorpha]BBN13892.1 hypothetical protein Mp_6g07240 [Marchantia polymorpha subsp. ruderalis]|eukprot:PTQ38092.1 hypothetical protein MARPO_0053s0038 [Marchantia polymorpha]
MIPSPSRSHEVELASWLWQIRCMQRITILVNIISGISTAALEENRPSLGAAKDVGGGHKLTVATSGNTALVDQLCPWYLNSFVGVNVNDAAARLFI